MSLCDAEERSSSSDCVRLSDVLTRGGTLLLSGKAYAISNKCLGFLNTKFKPAAAIGDKIGSYGLGKWCGAFGATGNFSGVFHTQHQPVSRDGSDSMVRSKACFCSSLL